jgi:hypothetical protein
MCWCVQQLDADSLGWTTNHQTNISEFLHELLCVNGLLKDDQCAIHPIDSTFAVGTLEVQVGGGGWEHSKVDVGLDKLNDDQIDVDFRQKVLNEDCTLLVGSVVRVVGDAVFDGWVTWLAAGRTIVWDKKGNSRQVYEICADDTHFDVSQGAIVNELASRLSNGNSVGFFSDCRQILCARLISMTTYE